MSRLAGVLAAATAFGATAEIAKREAIGEIEDPVVDAEDRVLHAVASVGEQLVTVPFGELRVAEDAMVYYDVTREDLGSAPAFLWNEPSRAAPIEGPRAASVSIRTKKVRIRKVRSPACPGREARLPAAGGAHSTGTAWKVCNEYAVKGAIRRCARSAIPPKPGPRYQIAAPATSGCGA